MWRSPPRRRPTSRGWRSCARSGCRSSERTKERTSSGTQGTDREVAQAAALQDARVLALQPLRPSARGLQEVRPVPNLPAGPRPPGRHPWHEHVEVITVQPAPIADMLTRIRNANQALLERAEMPTSRLKSEIARLLKEEGYITDFHVEPGEKLPYDTLVIELKYGRSRERVITDLKRVSKPGRVHGDVP